MRGRRPTASPKTPARAPWCNCWMAPWLLPDFAWPRTLREDAVCSALIPSITPTMASSAIRGSSCWPAAGSRRSALLVDLHTHSHCSDGTLTPAELVSRAAAAGVDVLALTDHDTVAGLGEAQAAANACGITLVPGV